MPRKRQAPLDDLLHILGRVPWWVGAGLAVASYLILHSLALQEVVREPGVGAMGEYAGHQLTKMLATTFQYILPPVFLVGAATSLFRRSERRRLHEEVAGDPSGSALRELSWSQFEKLVGEAFRRQGYRVLELGGNAPDGGVDLVVVRDDQHYLVQCKQWKAWSVGVKVVRELLGVVTAKGAAGGFVVTSGVFTKDAIAFADANQIKLLDGKILQAAVEQGKPASSEAAGWLPALVLAAVVVIGGLFWLLPRARPTAAPRNQTAAATQARSPAKPAEDRLAAQARRKRELEKQFDAQYVPPKGCDNWRSDKAMVECGNAYIRAKRAFFAAHGG